MRPRMKPARRTRSIVGRGPRPPRPPGGGRKLPPPRAPGAPKRPAAPLPSRKPPRKKAPPRPKQPRGSMPRWLKLLFLLLVLAIFGSGGYLYYRGRASLPQLDGSLKLTGLSAPVEVLRDPFGVPHIFGTAAEDIARATGFVHAQDRLFQMELSRRLGTGTVAEVLGEPGLSLDRRVRRIGLGLAAQTELERTDPEARAILDAYAPRRERLLDRTGGQPSAGVSDTRLETAPLGTGRQLGDRQMDVASALRECIGRALARTT